MIARGFRFAALGSSAVSCHLGSASLHLLQAEDRANEKLSLRFPGVEYSSLFSRHFPRDEGDFRQFIPFP